MTIFTGTKEELALWIAQRDILADQEIAMGQGVRLEEFQPRHSKIKLPA